VLEQVLAAVFDPAWNARHRVTIWICIVVILFLSGFGLPLPEDVPLTLSGFTTYKQSGETFIWWRYVITFGIVVVPILLGDLVAYWMGRRYGWAIRRFRFFRRMITDKGMARVQRWYDQYGSFTVFLGRQVAGVRFMTFYTAGTMKMKIGKFIFWDFLGCLVSVPVWLTLGRFAGEYGRAWMEAASTTVGRWFLLAVIILALGLFGFARYRSAHEPKEPEPEPPPQT
jgi:membrane protein DedA with SNARE-associated domain